MNTEEKRKEFEDDYLGMFGSRSCYITWTDEGYPWHHKSLVDKKPQCIDDWWEFWKRFKT